MLVSAQGSSAAGSRAGRRASAGALLIVGALTGLPVLLLAPSRWSSSPASSNQEADLGFLMPTAMRGGSALHNIVNAGQQTPGSSASRAASSSTNLELTAAAVLAAGLVSAAVVSARGGVRRSPVVVRRAEGAEGEKKDLSEFKVGDPVKGRIQRILKAQGNANIFVDVGAKRFALLQTEADDDEAPDYLEGMELEGLRVSMVDAEDNTLNVSPDKLAIDYTVGDEISGKVADVKPNFMLVSVRGLSRKALALPRGMEKDIADYKVGEEFTAKVMRVDTKTNTLILSQKDPAAKGQGKGSGSGKMEVKYQIKDLSNMLNQEVEGTVARTQTFGVFIDIGLRGTDGLAPAVRLPEGKLPTDFNPGDKVQCWIVSTNEKQMKVTLSLVAPGEGGFQQSRKGGGKGKGEGQGGGSKLPFNQMWPPAEDERLPEYQAVREVTDSNDLDITYLAEKYPHNFSVTDLTFPLKALRTFNGCINSDREHNFVVPPQLLKEGVEPVEAESDMQSEIVTFRRAGQRRKMVRNYSKYETEAGMSYDFRIKPEIHVKYRPYPMNNPNWVDTPLGKTKKQFMQEIEAMKGAGKPAPEPVDVGSDGSDAEA